MLKSRTKFIIVFIALLFGICLFNTNTVQASTLQTDVIIPNPIGQKLFCNIEQYVSSNQNNLMVDVDVIEAYKLTKNTSLLNSLVKEDNYVYQTIYVKTKEDVNEVALNGKKLEVEVLDGNKYFKYDMKIFEKIGENSYKVCCRDIAYYQDIANGKLEYKQDSSAELLEEFNVTMIANNINLGWVELVNEKGDRIDGYEHLSQGQGALDGYMGELAETRFDYSNAYYLVWTSQKNTNTINVENIGTLTYKGENYKDDEDRIWYGYKTKVKDPTVFYKAQEITYRIPTVNDDGENVYYFEFKGTVRGTERKTYKVDNKTNGITIALNGVTTQGASLKVDSIDKKDNTFIEMTTSINGIDKYINIMAYDINIINGTYEGEMLLTFELGEENNDKKVYIWHKKADGSLEDFDEIVKDGKVTIKVNELSPFLLAYGEKTTEVTEPKEVKEGEKDNTPKTGTETNILLYILGAVALIAGAGITTIKKYNK